MASNYLPDHPFDCYTTLQLLNKFDVIFVTLCTGKHPVTNLRLPGSANMQLMTQTQKVRIKSLAEQSRSMVFIHLNKDDDENENAYDAANDEEEIDFDMKRDDDSDGKWTAGVSAIYVGIITLLSDEFETAL